MSGTDSSCLTVEAAFEMLLEAMHNAMSVINSEGSRALAKYELSEAESALRVTKQMERIANQIAELQWQWTSVEAADSEDPIIVSSNYKIGSVEPASYLLQVTMQHKSATAYGIFSGGIVTVLSGSRITHITDLSLPEHIRIQRDFLEGSETIKRGQQDTLILSRDIVCSSASAAAQLVSGRITSGYREWTVDASGLPLGQHLRTKAAVMNARGVSSDAASPQRAWGVWKAKGRTGSPEKVTGPIDWERRALHAEAQIAELSREKYKYECLRGFIFTLLDPKQIADFGQNTPDGRNLLARITDQIRSLEWERHDTWKNFNGENYPHD